MSPETDKKRLETPPAATEVPASRGKPVTHPDQREHEGATEDQVTETTAPAGSRYDDEPRQG